MANGPVLKLHPTEHALDRSDDMRVPRTSFDELLTRPYLLVANKPERGGSHVLIGRNDRGDCLPIPVQRAHYAREWVAITVWRCDAAEDTSLGR
jgi:hypothetical protein